MYFSLHREVDSSRFKKVKIGNRARDIHLYSDKISRADIISSRLPLYVLHKLEIGALTLDLLNRAGREFVDQIAKNNAILQDILVITAWQFLAQHCLDPAKNFRFLFLVASLKKAERNDRKSA
jgi:hypothetical protein